MRAMVLNTLRTPLVPQVRPDPVPDRGQVVLRVEACAVCRTDLHLVDGDLPNPMLPIVPGHEIVGILTEVGDGVPRRISGVGSASRGLAIPAADAPIVSPGTRTFATSRFSPATRAMAVLRPMSLRTSIMPLTSADFPTRSQPPPCSAPG